MIFDLKDLDSIQNYYNTVCEKYGKLRIKANYKFMSNIKGLYIEIPFPIIYLNPELLSERTVHHELFHHLNPHLHDGDGFESLLTNFIIDIYSIKQDNFPVKV